MQTKPVTHVLTTLPPPCDCNGNPEGAYYMEFRPHAADCAMVVERNRRLCYGTGGTRDED